MPYLIAEEGPNLGLTLDLSDGDEWVIGRDPDEADFVIEDSIVSRKAALLTRTEEGISLKNLSQVNPTLVNGAEHEASVLLKENDRIQVGHTTFRFSQEMAPASQEKKKEKNSYDDIFGDIEELPPTPPEPEKLEPEEDLPSKSEWTAYDTIFEEVGDPEEMPFSLTVETPLLLKVIAGPNAGAEIGIEQGKVYTLGKDANTCDIVFQDLSVSRHHAKLGVSADGILDIEDLGSKNGTVVNGSVITEKTLVTPQDLVALGTTVFMIIDREAPQETIYSPMVPTYEPPKVAEEGLPPPPSEEVAPAPVTPLPWKKERIPTKHLILAGSIAAVFLIMFLSFFSLFKSKGIELVKKEPVSEIKEALAKFSDVQFSFNPGSGKLFVVGHVLTPIDYNEMNFRIGQIPFVTNVENNVVVDELVWNMMNEVIVNNPAWRSVSIHSSQAGKFVVSGYLTSVDEAIQLNDYLTVNFPYLDRLQNQVVVEEILNAQLQGMIAQAGLGAIAFQLVNGDVILTGRYDEQKKREFHALVKEINTTPGVHGVRDLSIATHPNLAAVDITSHYPVTGNATVDHQGYSIVVNSKIYTLGDKIDGMQITAIEPSTILLEKEGIKYKIDYSR